MSTLTISKDCSYGYAKAVLTYSLTQTETNATFTLSKIALTTNSTSGSAANGVSITKVEVSGPVSYSKSDSLLCVAVYKTDTVTLTPNKTKTWTKTTSPISSTLTFKITYYDRLADPSKTASTTQTLTINALKSYNIIYKANGHGTDPSQDTKYYNKSLTLKDSMGTQGNYVFKNWNTAANGSGTTYAEKATYSANSGTTLYAQWYPPYTISYNGNGSTGGSTSSDVKIYNQPKVVKSNGFTRTNCVFKNWNTKKDGSGTSYTAGSSSYSTNANVTLYAQWYLPYTITFNANGGTGGPSSGIKIYNQPYNIPSSVPSLGNAVFNKWALNENGSGTLYGTTDSYSTNANATFYAQWKYKPIVVSFSQERISEDTESDGNGNLIGLGTYHSDDEGYMAQVSINWRCDARYGPPATNKSVTFTAGIYIDSTCTLRLSNTSDVTVIQTTAASSDSKFGYGSFSINLGSSTSPMNVDSRYYIKIVATDSDNNSTTYIGTIPEAFFAIDVTSSGRSIGFGGAAKELSPGEAGEYRFYGNLVVGEGSSNNRDIYYQGPVGRSSMIRFLPNTISNYGNGISIGGGGLTLIGGGESANSLHDEIIGSLSDGEGTERLYLCSDNNIYFNTNCNTIGNRKECYIDTSGRLHVRQSYYTDSNYSDVTIGTSSNNGVTENTSIGDFSIYDAHGTLGGAFVSRTGASGEIVSYMRARNKKTDGTDVNNYFNIFANKNGTVSYNVTDKAAFRNAIGASSGIFPISVGGTGNSGTYTTTNVPDIYSVSDKTTAVSGAYAQWGKVAMVQICVQLKTAIAADADGNLTNVTMGTLKNHPAVVTAFHMVEYGGIVNVGTDGVLSLGCVNSNCAVPKDTNLHIRGVYILP